MPDCDGKFYAKGLCHKHYERKRKGGDPTKERLPERERFLSRLDKTSDPRGCWIYTGTILSTGYGQFSDDSGVRWLAHRFSYTIHVGPIAMGDLLDHLKCDNPPCCNPEHLKPCKTNWENVGRSLTSPSAINARKTHCQNGHPFDDQNTSIGSKGERKCKRCAANDANVRRTPYKRERIPYFERSQPMVFFGLCLYAIDWDYAKIAEVTGFTYNYIPKIAKKVGLRKGSALNH